MKVWTGLRTATWTAACVVAASAAIAARPSAAPIDLGSAQARDRLFASPTRESMLALHQMLADEPHIAGTTGDWRTIREIEGKFREWGGGLEGWSVEVHEFHPLLPVPIAAELEILSPEPVKLELRERGLGDADAIRARGEFAYLGYAASGEVRGEVVYANYGTKQDFDTLRRLGVDVRGKLVLARFGGNYRGFKVKFAEEAGAAGVIMFTDPADAGFGRGPAYPEGGWASDCCVQRGSILTMGYQGDPLTPGIEASQDAPRLPLAQAPLPKIPAQPIGYAGAAQLIRRMAGAPLPADLAKTWTGGLPMEYKLTGGPGLLVRLMIEQRREVTPTANVVATLRGAAADPAERERFVVIGCHHDAWNNGAADPTCGTIAMMEAARAFADLARAGLRPRRSIVFAAWGAEEHGIIGSTEWVERERDRLRRDAIAYINLDMASMGPIFGASASPELKTLIAAVAGLVPQARDAGATVASAWRARSAPPPVPQRDAPDAGTSEAPFPVGDVGGGSDHVPFLMHAGVPSASFGSGGSQGWSYHSAYDTLPWYWKVVGDDYEPAIMVARMTMGVTLALVDAEHVPLDHARVLAEARGHLREIDRLAREAGWGASQPADAWATPGLAEIDRRWAERSTTWRGDSRHWLLASGLPGRPWYMNAYVATDEDSGYSNWLLPGLRRAAERRDREQFDRMAEAYADLPRMP